MKNGGLELHINELVLKGFAPGDRYRIAEGMERELARLLAEQGVASSLTWRAEVARLNAGAIRVMAGAKPERTGVEIARAVHRALAR